MFNKLSNENIIDKFGIIFFKNDNFFWVGFFQNDLDWDLNFFEFFLQLGFYYEMLKFDREYKFVVQLQW